jgi:hypothetical protein
MTDDVTKTVIAKDGGYELKDGDKTIRLVPEADLLAIKGSSKTALEQAKSTADALTAEAAKAKADVESAHQKSLAAEAKVAGLTEQLTKVSATSAEAAQLKAELETAKNSGKELGDKYLELRRATVADKWKVPPATVAKKSLAELDVYEQALNDITGGKPGNYAFGGASGAAADLAGKSPLELAQLAYAKDNKK